MTVQLFGRDATNVEKLLVAWLKPLGLTAIKRKAGDPLPQQVVNEIMSTDDAYHAAAYPLVSLHYFGSTEAQVISGSDAMHQRMMVLVDCPGTGVTMEDSSVAMLEWVETVERPHWEFYSDTVLRKVARYRLAVPFIRTGS